MQGARPAEDSQTGFIHHPPGFPLQSREIKPKWFTQNDFEEQDPSCPQIGLIFSSDTYHKPGSIVEITIPVRNRVEKFIGKVVLVRHDGNCYETGLWLKHGDDASRARIVVQICHIEAYLLEKKYREGPYNLNPDRVASEWIAKYAGGVPTL